jgi:hypothetical protein
MVPDRTMDCDAPATRQEDVLLQHGDHGPRVEQFRISALQGLVEPAADSEHRAARCSNIQEPGSV